MFQCPKERGIILQAGEIASGLSAYCCPKCGGAWIPPKNYSNWRCQQGDANGPLSPILPSNIELEKDFQPSPLDAQAALCPDCKHYMVRGRVNLKSDSFFVERCPNCKGLWCDVGEWPVLEALGLNIQIEQIFSGEWQTKVRELELLERERLATIEKLGPAIADRLFELTELLEAHPNGDYGVAYLMRRFEQ